MNELEFYPTISRGEAGKYLDGTMPRILLTASSFAADEIRKYGIVRKKIAIPNIPDTIVDRAADCGGFVATFKWKGIYKYTAEQYVDWLDSWHPTWCATMDYCCEEEILSGRQGIVEERQKKTTENAYMFFERWKDRSYTWVPTIQGWSVSDYIRHATEMKPLILKMQAYYEKEFRVGIGTLCHRANVHMIRYVIEEVVKVLGNVDIHLWGVKQAIFKSPIALPKQVRSCDSAAFNGMFYSDRDAWKYSGKRQTQYTLENALPTYEKKLLRYASSAKMHKTLFD